MLKKADVSELSRPPDNDWLFLCSAWKKSFGSNKRIERRKMFLFHYLQIAHHKFFHQFYERAYFLGKITMLQDIKATCRRAKDLSASLGTFRNHLVDSLHIFVSIQIRPSIFFHETSEDSQIVSEEQLLNWIGHMMNGIVEAWRICSLFGKYCAR